MSVDHHTDAVRGDDRALAGPSAIRRLFSTTATWVFLVNVALYILFGLLSDGQAYWSTRNLQNLMTGGAQALLLSVGVAVLMAAGIFDLSLGASLVLSSVAGALVIRGLSVVDPATGFATGSAWIYIVGFLACIATGIGVGLVNGFFITKLRVNALIATLGTLGIATGFAYVLSGGQNVSNLPGEMTSILALRKVFGIPASALLALAIAAAFHIMLRYTAAGTQTLAVGSSRTSADRAGLRVDRIHVILLVIVGALCGVAGFMDLSRFTSTAIAGHVNDGLAAVTAAVIGGTALAGGRTSIMGVIWGTLLSVQLLTGLLIISVPPFYQLVATGLFLVVAVWLDGLRTAKRDHR